MLLAAAARGGKILLVDAAGIEVWEPRDAESALLTLLGKAGCYPRTGPK